jgi:transposase
VYRDMEQWTRIRVRVKDGESKRQVLRETGMHWRTLEKILSNPAPPKFGRQVWPKRKIGPFLERITSILLSDTSLPKKQRHTAKRIFERIREEGYQGGYTAVKDTVRALKQELREVYVPLVHKPGEAQVDFGYALVKQDGVLRRVAFFVMALPYSDSIFVAAYERECTETFQDGHVRAFEFFGGVPHRISYDNSKICVTNILGGRDRTLTDGFLRLQSHYLFDHHFCLVRRPNEKGVVENTVKYARLNFFVPVPQVSDLEELNAFLLERCKSDLGRRLRGKAGTKAQLLKEDQAAFQELPPSPFDASRKTSTTVNSLSLVRFDCNDYSVPVCYAHRPVVVKGYVDRVRIYKDDELISDHPRIWAKEKVLFNPVHYLALIEQKPGALDYARPLEDWDLPECFGELRTRLEAELNGSGAREFVKVLRLLEKHSLSRLTKAVQEGLRIHAHKCDAITQFLYSAEKWRPSTFSLDGREHLKGVKIDKPDLDAYQSLLEDAPDE